MQRDPESETATLFAGASPSVAPVKGQAGDKPNHKPGVNPAPTTTEDPIAVADKVVAILAEHRRVQEAIEEDDFRWRPSNEAIVVPEQQALALYENDWLQVVIRQERAWDQDEDTFIVISKNNLPTLIARLQAYLPNAGQGGK